MAKLKKKDIIVGAAAFLIPSLLFASGGGVGSLNMVNDVPTLPTAGTYPTRSLGDIEYIIIHHTACKSCTVEGIANYHINSRGWKGIGYHFVIDRDGVVHQTNNIETRSNHIGNLNTKSVGVSFIGNFEEEQTIKAQTDQLPPLIRYIENYVGKQLKIRSHDAFSNTACCGMYLKAQLPSLISRARN